MKNTTKQQRKSKDNPLHKVNLLTSEDSFLATSMKKQMLEGPEDRVNKILHEGITIVGSF